MKIDGDDAARPEIQLLHPQALAALVQSETRLRVDYRDIPEAPTEVLRRILRMSAELMEFLYLSAVLVEVAHRHELKSIREITQFEGLDLKVRSLTNLRAEDVFAQNATLIEQIRKGPLPSVDDPIPAMTMVVSAVESILRPPVPDFAQLALIANDPELGARCQVVQDALRRFVKRNDPWIDEKLKVVGPDYAAGALSLDDVCRVLQLEPTDAVAFLEDFGYCRPLEHVALRDEERDQLYGALRASRLQGTGQPAARPTTIVRDVIATQRIEGVDARGWIDPKLM